MASILDRYGIKEVADVTFYEIKDDGSRGNPVLYLDTLKVSTIEQTAEQAEARGGKGNPPLIIWDYGKEITVTLEDALFSPKSLAIMFGSGTVATEAGEGGGNPVITKTISFIGTGDTPAAPTVWTAPDGTDYTITDPVVTDETGRVHNAAGTDSDTEFQTLVAGNRYYATFDLEVVGRSVSISALNFPGTYYITGDTYARSDITGRDEFFQFIIPKAKMNAENTITLEAEGDPSVFNMSLRVMRPADGQMMKLVQYSLHEDGEVTAP